MNARHKSRRMNKLVFWRLQVLPFYVNLALVPFESDTQVHDYEKVQKLLTMLRLLRVFRVMKLARHSQDLQACTF